MLRMLFRPMPCGLASKSVPTRVTSSRHLSSIYEPDYLDTLAPQQPIYDLINVQMKGYDFTILEHYQRYVHRTANYLGLNVVTSWATPAQSLQITTYKPQSTIVDNVYKLKLYERNVQISEFPCSFVPVFFEIIRCSMPEGLQLNVHPHSQEHDEIRHIPDIELLELKSQLEDVSSGKTKKRR